jgi:ferredoxin
LLLAAAGKGRIWCNWICPAGTLFDLLSRRAAYPDRVRRQCSLCQACFTSSDGSPRGAERSGSSGVTRRQVLRGAISAVAVEAAAPAALASPHRRKTRPPGAVDEVDFKRLCVGCGLCVSRCKGSCLSLSSDFSDFGQVQMDFGAGACLLSCGMDCAKACPAGALRRIPGASRRDIHMGLAEWKREICLGDGNGCTACIDACPVKALTRRNGLVEIDAHRCIGCGACEFACPASPEKAISVNGFAKQRVIHSSDSEGLAKEMRFLAEHGVAAIAAKGGKITAQKKGVGVAPLLELLDEGYIEGAMVMDRVCGRAAAAICVCGGAKSVRALVMGADAAEMLRKRSVECSAERIVPCVLDAKRIAKCPYDKAVEGIDDPAAMVEELKKLESKKGK